MAESTKFDSPTNGMIDESLKAQVLAEEEAAMNQYKVTSEINVMIKRESNTFQYFLFDFNVSRTNCTVQGIFSHNGDGYNESVPIVAYC